jgi:hypothetical protein
MDLIRLKGSAAAAAGYSAVGSGGVGAGAAGGLTCRAPITTRGMWTDNGRLLDVLHQVRRDLSATSGQPNLEVQRGSHRTDRFLTNLLELCHCLRQYTPTLF